MASRLIFVYLYSGAFTLARRFSSSFNHVVIQSFLFFPFLLCVHFSHLNLVQESNILSGSKLLPSSIISLKLLACLKFRLLIILKRGHSPIICLTVICVPQLLHFGGLVFSIKYLCVNLVCPLLILAIITSFHLPLKLENFPLSIPLNVFSFGTILLAIRLLWSREKGVLSQSGVIRLDFFELFLYCLPVHCTFTT